MRTTRFLRSSSRQFYLKNATAMPLKEGQICVFCGKKPENKTREHIVPSWLHEITGDPSRVATIGFDFENNRPIRFSWSNFAVPACDACNNKSSDLETRAKPHIEALQRREALSAKAYTELLDWLDKVRVGVWLALHLIEKYPSEVFPNFYISSRIGEKDRMVAVYVFDSDNKGINLFGCDSLVFKEMPSCFGLRINNILLLSVSSDFFCSRGCGFPYPRSLMQLMGGPNSGKLELKGTGQRSEVSNPITRLSLFKPVVWLYQPIRRRISEQLFYGQTDPSDQGQLELRRQGALFRQYKDRVEVISDPDALIEFDSVVGDECAMQSAIAASVYSTQADLCRAIKFKWQSEAGSKRRYEEYHAMKIADCEARVAAYLSNKLHSAHSADAPK